MTENGYRDLVVRYYDACNAADVEGLLAVFDPEMTHYFLAPNPACTALRGAQAVAETIAQLQRSYDGRWVVDYYLGDGAEAVIEWTLYWTSPKTGERVATRGAELYRFRKDTITEVRAYYRQRHESSELEGFDYVGRGYSLAESEASTLHHPDRHRPAPEATP